MSVIRNVVICVGLGVIMALAAPDRLRAQSKSALIDMCAAQAQAEFEGLAISFDKIRRRENRNFAFGEIELNDGTTRRIRCRVQRGQVRGIRFRNDGAPVGSRWTQDRPPAELLTPASVEPDEPETDGAAQAEPDAETEVDVDNPAEPEADAETQAEAENPAQEEPESQ